MSKLFDQLKNAARGRQQPSPGLLLEALQKAKSAPGAEAIPVADEIPAAPPAADTTPSRGSYTGIAVAIAIFAAVLVAWHAAPWRAPAKVRIDPTDLKLDRSLDLQRPAASDQPKG